MIVKMAVLSVPMSTSWRESAALAPLNSNTKSSPTDAPATRVKSNVKSGLPAPVGMVMVSGNAGWSITDLSPDTNFTSKVIADCPSLLMVIDVAAASLPA